MRVFGNFDNDDSDDSDGYRYKRKQPKMRMSGNFDRDDDSDDEDRKDQHVRSTPQQAQATKTRPPIARSNIDDSETENEKEDEIYSIKTENQLGWISLGWRDVGKLLMISGTDENATYCNIYK